MQKLFKFQISIWFVLETQILNTPEKELTDFSLLHSLSHSCFPHTQLFCFSFQLQLKILWSNTTKWTLDDDYLCAVCIVSNFFLGWSVECVREWHLLDRSRFLLVRTHLAQWNIDCRQCTIIGECVCLCVNFVFVYLNLCGKWRRRVVNCWIKIPIFFDTCVIINNNSLCPQNSQWNTYWRLSANGVRSVALCMYCCVLWPITIFRDTCTLALNVMERNKLHLMWKCN